MALQLSHAQAIPKSGPNKLVLGFMAAAITALVGLAGLAGAAPASASNSLSGYGGNHNNGNTTNINGNINIHVGGNNNVVQVVINYIIGG